MDDELRCVLCRRASPRQQPILLSCGHSACRACALSSATLAGAAATAGGILSPPPPPPSSHPPQSPPSSSSSDLPSTSSTVDSPADVDRVSVLSETDSGVVQSGSTSQKVSRPASMMSGTSSSSSASSSGSLSGSRLPSLLTPLAKGLEVVCPTCQRSTLYADETALRSAPVNRALVRLLTRWRTASAAVSKEEPSERAAPVQCCQLCESGSARVASIYCEQCEIHYCTACQSTLHPARGPLARHSLIPSNSSSSSSTLKEQQRSSRPASMLESSGAVDYDPSSSSCSSHPSETPSMWCTFCRVPVCALCLGGDSAAEGGAAAAAAAAALSMRNPHSTHDVHPLAQLCKANKAELSTTLSQLGEKARAASDEIAQLRGLHDHIGTVAADVRAAVSAQIDVLIEALEARRSHLLDVVEREADYKRAVLREQIARCTGKVGRTTSLVHFCIELLKEPDPAAFMQIAAAMHGRATAADFLWASEMRTRAEATPDFALTLDVRHAANALRALDFAQTKGGRCGSMGGGDFRIVPGAPSFVASECAAENNSVSLVWRAAEDDGAAVDGFALEIDSGRDDGVFREVYVGAECCCTLDGLHFATVYNARIRAFNAAGHSAYSQPVCLQTAQLAWFALTRSASQHRDVSLSSDGLRLTGVSLDYRTVLGSVALSKGKHYWEVHVERVDANADLVVGVAQPPVGRQHMLGKDLHGWSMYVDQQRSWLLHNDAHSARTIAGVQNGSVIGVLLDCERGRLSFAIDGRRRAGFDRLPRGLYYPAFSVNYKAAILVQSGLDAPPEFRDNNDNQ